MKRTITVLLLLLGICLHFQLYATHIVGAELEYECVNPLNNTYKITLTLYRDCARGEAEFDDVVTLFLFDNAGNPINFVNIPVPPVTPQIQPETFDACIAIPPDICVEEGIYETTLILPPRVGGYDIAWARCCRNSAINNLAVPLREGVSFLAHVPDPADAVCNSMPKFENVPPVFLCNDQTFSFDHSATDIDGDSLSYAITDPYTGLNQQGIGAGNPNFGQVPPRVNTTNNPMGPPPYLNVEFATGFNFADPFGSRNFEIDPKTGFIQVTPNRAGIYVYAISVFEWRDGKLLSENKRDFQIHVINCRVQGEPPIITHDLSRLTTIEDTILINAKEDFCYDINVRDVNVADQLTAFSVSSAFGNGNFFPPAATFNFGGINPIQGQVCWNINCAYEGQVIPLVVGARDINDCPNIGNVFDTVYVKVQVPPNTPPVITPDYTGLRLDNDTIVVRAEDDLCFTFDATDAESNILLPYTISDIFASANPPEFMFTGNGPVDGEICWTPGCELSDQVIEVAFGVREVNVCRVSAPVINSVYVRIEAPVNEQPVIQKDLSGLIVEEDTIFVNALEELCYTYSVTDLNDFDSVRVSAFGNIFSNDVGATFSPSGINPVEGEVCWTPSCDYSDQLVQIIVMAEDNPACSERMPIYDTVYVKINPDLSLAPEVSHTFTGGIVNEDTVTLQVGEDICYDFTVRDRTPFTDVNYEYEFQTFEGTNIALGSVDISQQSDGIQGSFCFQSDCSNGGSLYRVIIKGVDGGLCPPFPVAYDTVYIKVETDFVADLGPDISFCDGEGGTQLTVGTTGGNGPFFYSWGCVDPLQCGLSDPNAQSPIVNPAGETTYFVQLTDQDGCTSEIDSINVGISALPIVETSLDQVICQGDDVQLEAALQNENEVAQPIEFEWFPKEGLSDAFIANPIASPDQSTIYTVVATVGRGCSSSATNLDTLSTVEVQVLPVPIAEAGEDREICEGDTISLSGFASGGSPNYTYEWFPDSDLLGGDTQSPMVSPVVNTTYYFRVYSDGCSGNVDSLLVEVHPAPVVTPLAAYTMCAYDTLQLIGTASGDPLATYSYNWETVEGINDLTEEMPMVNPQVNTTFRLTATSSFGCAEVFEFPVEVLPTPFVNAGEDVPACAGDEIALNASHEFRGGDGVNFPDDVDYSWTPAAGLSDSFIANPILLPSQTTIFTVTATYGACETEDDLKVDVFSPFDFQLNADTTGLCSGESLALGVSGTTSGAKFTWSPATGLNLTNEANIVASPEEDITYFVLIEDGGCIRTDSISLSVSQTPKAEFLVSPQVGCEDLLVTFAENTESGSSFTWDFGDGTISNDPLGEHLYDTPGVYQLTMNAEGPTGCKSGLVSTEIVVTEKGIASFDTDPPGGSNLFLPDPNIEITNNSQFIESYLWDFGDGNSSTDASPKHDYIEPGEYSITLITTDAGGCMDTITVGTFTIIAPELLIPNVFSPNSDGLNDIFKVKYLGKEPFSMKVYDRWGNPMFEEPSNVQNGWDGIEPNGKAASEGVYYYFIQIGEKAFRGDVTLLR